jgi:very-short-patch-repair endonuclease
MGCGVQESVGDYFAVKVVQRNSSFGNRSIDYSLRCSRYSIRGSTGRVAQGSVDKMDEPPRFRQSSRKFARVQRQNMTRAETMLWRAVRNHQIDGHGFRRQTPIGPYFADFVCLARKIVVEADGRTHEAADAKIKDAERDAWLRRAGFRVLRFPDELVIGGLPIVIERIRAALRET